MTGRKKNSRKQFREFVKEKGIFSLGKNDDGNSEDSVPSKSLKYYLSRYIQGFKGQKSRLLMVMLMGLFANLIGAAIPWSSKIMIDNVLPQRNIVLLAAACGFLFLIAIMQFFISLFQDYSVQLLLNRYTVDLKQRLLRHLHTLPLVELQKLKTGGIITRLQEDTEAAGGMIFHGLLTPFNAFSMFFIAIASLFLVNWKTIIVCIFFVSAMCGLAYFFFHIMRPFQRSLRKDKSTINANLTEVFGGIQVVKSFCRENTVRMDYALGTNLLLRKHLYGFVFGAFVHRGIWFIHFTAEISIWFIGGYCFINGTLSIGGIVVFISFLMWIFRPVFMVMSSFAETQRCLACTERTIDLFDMEPDIVDKESALSVKKFREGIRFNKVSFKYPDGTLALDNVDLFIPKGKVTALVGPSGGGKTTLTNLVLRFYEVTEGSVTVDNEDIRDIKLSSYRKLMSLVLQDVFLFDGTVNENIRFGKRNATQEEVEQAAETAHCDEFIQKLKDKYDTIIGERGVKLSGGQKQRLALARALVADPQLLILDEATSNLDSESESLIQDALRHIFKDRTTLVIAHRLSTIMDADNIIVIDKGKVVEEGRHSELLNRKGKYFEMYTKQMEKAKSLENIWISTDTDEKQNEQEAE